MTSQLIQASLGGAIAVAVVWLVCRLMPTLSASTKAWLWWFAAAKFVIALVWTSPIAIAVLPSSTSPSMVASSTASMTDAAADSAALLTSVNTSASVAPKSFGEPMLLALWVAGVAMALLVGVQRGRRAHRIIRDSRSADDSSRAMLDDVAQSLQLGATPELRVSDEVDTPLVVGILHPVVIVPGATFDALDHGQQRMALAHECAHVRRRDLRYGCVPALAETLFFFHPLARLASREYALWREAACDAAVIDALDAAPKDYGQLLLGLGVTKPRVGLAAAGASWSTSNLKRRLHMLAEPTVRSNRSRLLSVAVVVAAAAALTPIHLTERLNAAIVPMDAPSTADAVSRPDPEQRADRATAPTPQKRIEPNGDLNFVLLHDDDTSTMSGRFDDIKRVKQLAQGQRPMLWFRHNNVEYSTRDAKALQEALAIWKPIREIGEEQGKVGEAQGVVGEQQGQIGELQGKIGETQGRLGEEQAELALREAELSLRAGRAKSDADRRAIDKDRDALDTRLDALSTKMKRLDVEMQSLDKVMSDIDKRMQAVGAPMEALSRKMEAAQQSADAQMKALIERLVSSGVAQRVK